MSHSRFSLPVTTIAPADEMVYYLAVFQRSFAAIARYAENDDRDGMLFGGYLADALHNVPRLLLNWSDDSGWSSTPAKMQEWLGQIFPGRVAQSCLSTHIISDCRNILIHEGSATALGLREDVSDLDLAPQEDLCRYLDMLYHTCLLMRQMFNYGSLDSRLGALLRRTGLGWSRQAREHGQVNSLLASVLVGVPAGLAKWNSFDEASVFSQLEPLLETIQIGWARENTKLLFAEHSPLAPR